MEIIRYIVAAYILIGFMVAGGLFFTRRPHINVFLAIFVFLFSLDGLYFLYESGDLLKMYPHFHLINYPINLVFGPVIYFHIRSLAVPAEGNVRKLLLHLLPFMALFLFTCYLFTMPALDRIKFMGGAYYYTIARPINYFKVAHLLFYGILMLLFIRKKERLAHVHQKTYAKTIVFIYLVTAVLQASFTAAIMLSHYFIIYYLVAFTLVLTIGYMLYFEPAVFQKLKVKYAKSTLSKSDRVRILQKIETYLAIKEQLVNQTLDLAVLAQHISEKKHHISQTLSQELNTSFNGYVNKHRVEYSKLLLRNPSYDKFKISAIATDVGFTNKNTFNRAFIKYNVCTPSEYRKG